MSTKNWPALLNLLFDVKKALHFDSCVVVCLLCVVVSLIFLACVVSVSFWCLWVH